jgi:rhamnosyltransferase subunit B
MYTRQTLAAQRRAPDFLFENVGSHGDIMPLIAIAAELVSRGHRCQLLANEHFRTECTTRGIGFFANTPARTHGEIQAEIQSKHAVPYFFLKTESIREYFEQPGAFDERTVMVHTNAYGGSDPLAEVHRLRTVELVLFPIRIRSAIAPAWPLGARANAPDGEQFLKVLPALYHSADRHPVLLEKINSVRVPLGLPPVGCAQYERPHVVAKAAMFPDWFGMPAADWPELECLGFPLPASDPPLPLPVQEFLQRCPCPIVFTTGTGFGGPEIFFEAAAACCAELGRPGVFLSSFLAATPRALGDRIACFAHVELDRLLPHTAAIVHHGGMGTTARALEAGIPQVISPTGFDQPDNGHRTEVLGVGRVVPRTQMSGATFAAALREQLNDPEQPARLARYRAALAGSRAVERAADLLESVARRALN